MHELDSILKEPTVAIADPCFQLPIAGEENPIYRERAYCYELYQQLRMCWLAGVSIL